MNDKFVFLIADSFLMNYQSEEMSENESEFNSKLSKIWEILKEIDFDLSTDFESVVSNYIEMLKKEYFKAGMLADEAIKEYDNIRLEECKDKYNKGE